AQKMTRRILSVLRWPLGGIRTYIKYKYPLLATKGNYCFTFVGPADASYRLFRRELSCLEGSVFLEVEVKRRYCPLWSTVRKLLQRGSFDLIHSHGLTAAAHAAFANMWFNIPHVVTSHDVFRPNQTTGFSNRIKLCLLGQLLHSVDAIVSGTKQAQ